jgi:hypothetical protein
MIVRYPFFKIDRGGQWGHPIMFPSREKYNLKRAKILAM